MKNNICNFPCKITVDGVSYLCDFDHKSIDILETVTGLGFYDIYEKFLVKNSLTGGEIIDLISVSTLKYQGISAVERVKNFLSENREILLDELAVFKVHFKNLLPEIVRFLDDLRGINPQYRKSVKSSPFYDFEGNYALARKYLLWSDEEFWLATPKKLCFALISLAKFEKEKEKFLQNKQTEDCINFLNGIKRML